MLIGDLFLPCLRGCDASRTHQQRDGQMSMVRLDGHRAGVPAPASQLFHRERADTSQNRRPFTHALHHSRKRFFYHPAGDPLCSLARDHQKCESGYSSHPSTRFGPSPSSSPAPAGPFTLLTFGGEGTGPGLFKDAAEIAVDAGGNIYVSDDTLRIQKFDAAGKFVDLWTINEKGAEKLHHGPEGLLADRAGNVYVILGGVIVKYKGENGERLGIAHGTDYIENAAVLADGSLMIVSSKDGDDELVHLGANGKDVKRVHKFVSNVQGKEMTVEAMRVAVDGLGNTFALYALGDVTGEHWYDSEDLAVFKFTPAGKYVSKFGSEGNAPGQFKMPNAIAIDNQSRVYVSDAFNGILIFADDGRYLETIKPPHAVEAMAFDAENHLFIVGANKVTKLQLSK